LAPIFFSSLSDAQERASRPEEALSSIQKVFASIGEQHLFLPNMFWRRGKLHFQRGEQSKAEADLREAIAVARRIGSKAYELHATATFARLFGQGSRRIEARATLARVYNRFTEGFDTTELRDARAVLADLSK
jgi:hypothetical protein